MLRIKTLLRFEIISLALILVPHLLYGKVTLGLNGGYSTFLMMDNPDIKSSRDWALWVQIKKINEKFIVGINSSQLYEEKAINNNSNEIVLAIPVTVRGFYRVDKLTTEKIESRVYLGLGSSLVRHAYNIDVLHFIDYSAWSPVIETGITATKRIFWKICATMDIGIRYIPPADADFGKRINFTGPYFKIGLSN